MEKLLKSFFISTILILSVIVTGVGADEIADRFQQQIHQAISDSLQKGNTAWHSWENGIKEDLHGTLKKMDFKLERLQVETDQAYTVLVLRGYFIGYFINKVGYKERLVVIRTMAFLCEHKSMMVLRVSILNEIKQILPGWNGKDC